MTIYSLIVALWAILETFVVITYRGQVIRAEKHWKVIKYISWAYLLYLAGAK
jgi:hypothetical protein